MGSSVVEGLDAFGPKGPRANKPYRPNKIGYTTAPPMGQAKILPLTRIPNEVYLSQTLNSK